MHFKMKITKALLRKIIKEELLKEIEPDTMDQHVEKTIQDLLAQAKKESDPKKREELAKKAQKLIADEFYYRQRGMEY